MMLRFLPHGVGGFKFGQMDGMMFNEIKRSVSLNFKARISVRITDHNYGDHIANSAYVEYLHEGRVQYLASLGYSEKDVEGTALTLSELHVKYVKEGRYPDALTLEIGVTEVRGARFEIDYRGFGDSGDLLILARTKMASIDPLTGAPVRLPQAAALKFGQSNS